MIMNSAMKTFLDPLFASCVLPDDSYPIWAKNSQAGQPYWGTGHFYGMNKAPIPQDHDLTQLEWDGNEVHISTPAHIPTLLLRGLGIVAGWAAQMKQDYGHMPFDIILSLDIGEEDVEPSVTLRFCAVRNHIHYIMPTAEVLEGFCQPVLIEQVNCAQ